MSKISEKESEFVDMGDPIPEVEILEKPDVEEKKDDDPIIMEI